MTKMAMCSLKTAQATVLKALEPCWEQDENTGQFKPTPFPAQLPAHCFGIEEYGWLFIVSRLKRITGEIVVSVQVSEIPHAVTTGIPHAHNPRTMYAVNELLEAVPGAKNVKWQANTSHGCSYYLEDFTGFGDPGLTPSG